MPGIVGIVEPQTGTKRPRAGLFSAVGPGLRLVSHVGASPAAGASAATSVARLACQYGQVVERIQCSACAEAGPRDDVGAVAPFGERTGGPARPEGGVEPRGRRSASRPDRDDFHQPRRHGSTSCGASGRRSRLVAVHGELRACPNPDMDADALRGRVRGRVGGDSHSHDENAPIRLAGESAGAAVGLRPCRIRRGRRSADRLSSPDVVCAISNASTPPKRSRRGLA